MSFSGSLRQIRNHQDIGFADSINQDMEFWRQRVGREDSRAQTPSLFTSREMDTLPMNPFRDSGGMLPFGARGVSPRTGDTSLGVLKPDLAAYRAAVQPLTRTAQPNVWHLPSAFNRPTTANSEALPEIRAMRGMARIAAFTSPADSIGFGSPRGAYTKPSDKFESPNSRISAPFRRVLPRSKLDAKMWAQSPG